jgi:hypothetical protein
MFIRIIYQSIQSVTHYADLPPLTPPATAGKLKKIGGEQIQIALYFVLAISSPPILGGVDYFRHF